MGHLAFAAILSHHHNKDVEKMLKHYHISIVLLSLVFIFNFCDAIPNIFNQIATLEWKSDGNETEFGDFLNSTLEDDRAICTPPLLIHGSVNPINSQYKSEDVIRIVCNDGFELENIQSSLLYCSKQGLWRVFTLGDSSFLPLPRCIAKRRCPQLPPLIQGSIHIQGNEFNGLRSGSDLSTTRAVYKCWFGLELEPAESETRYCVQGKWTGENPQCVRAGCGRPPTINRGYYASHGIVNHVYLAESFVKYHCDMGYRLNGPSILTCSSEKEWIPKQRPSCTPIESNVSVKGCPVPPMIAKGEYQILPWRTGNSSTIPFYSSAVYMCHRGYILHGSSYISCSPHGWWQPFTVPRCIPEGGLISGEISDPDVDEGSLPWLVSLTTGFGVIFGLSLIWIASRIQINCRKTQVSTVCHAVNGAGVNGSSASTPSSGSSGGAASSGRRSLWDWMARQPTETLLRSESHEDDTNDSMTTLVSTDPDQDRVALIAYMNQTALPTYEEAVRATWPLAPPPYESILVEGVETESITSIQSPSAQVMLESDDAAADNNSSVDFDSPSLTGGMDYSDLNSSCEALVPSSVV